MSAAKQKGTRAETAVVDYLRANGYPAVERRATSGAKDKGDIAGLLDVVVEVKSCAKLEFSKWLAEAATEKDNAKAAVGVVWAKRRGKGSPADWYVVLSGSDFMELLGAWFDN